MKMKKKACGIDVEKICLKKNTWLLAIINCSSKSQDKKHTKFICKIIFIREITSILKS